MTLYRSFLLVACCLGGALAWLRWLRVAQREHYLPGAVSRFVWRWWGRSALDVALCSAAIASAIAAFGAPFAGLVAAVIVGFGPRGLSLRGRTARLAWTRRLLRTASLAAIIAATPIALVAVFAPSAVIGVAALVGVFVPLVIEASLVLSVPIERVLLRPYLRRAAARLAAVKPKMVAITGSYGKTSTKVYAAHLLASRYSVVASPRSFNNLAGLSRAVNENVGVGTEVFVAEMAAYGEGEIAELCRWFPPSIAVITAIGPVHLERFKSLERTTKAKAEITARADVVILNVDDERLAALADQLDAEKRVIRCSARRTDVDVAVIGSGDGIELFSNAVSLGTTQLLDGAATNIACACAVALVLECPSDEIVRRLGSLPSPDHRLTASASDDGVLVLDDTFNSNPAGSRLALSTLEKSGGASSRRVVVTPGMIELGPLQHDENAAFACDAAQVASDVVVVNATNRRALLSGLERDARAGQVRVEIVSGRADAVAWVRGNLQSGDVVLYENDLPDHYP